KSSPRGLKNSLVLFERTFALRQGFKPLPDYWLYVFVDTNWDCRVLRCRFVDDYIRWRFVDDYIRGCFVDGYIRIALARRI
ncbi:MAG: hypothetical protein EAZ68_11880, partial [Oscillatoriales cyanobacterium]